MKKQEKIRRDKISYALLMSFLCALGAFLLFVMNEIVIHDAKLNQYILYGMIFYLVFSIIVVIDGIFGMTKLEAKQ